MRKNVKKVGQIKATGTGLEGFVDWVDPISSEPAEERDDDMSSLANGFSTTMCKRVASTQGETTPGFEVSGGKCLKRPGLDEEDQKSLIVITVDSPE